MKSKLVVFIFILGFLFKADTISADSYIVVSHSATTINNSNLEKTDNRVKILYKFFEKHNSPLKDYSDFIVKTADKYELDWRLIPAISGVESTFGKRIPKNSYNAYGWSNGNYNFESWEDSIEHVSKYLKEKYINRGLTTVDRIAPIYAPPSTTWSWKVKFFIDQIEPLPIEFDL